MSHGIVQSNGTEIAPGDWLHIKFKSGEYVGRFGGVYRNPHHGLMYRLVFARRLDAPEKHDQLFCSLEHPNGCAEALDQAIAIDKPTYRKGKLTFRAKVPEGTVFH